MLSFCIRGTLCGKLWLRLPSAAFRCWFLSTFVENLLLLVTRSWPRHRPDFSFAYLSLCVTVFVFVSKIWRAFCVLVFFTFSSWCFLCWAFTVSIPRIVLIHLSVIVVLGCALCNCWHLMNFDLWWFKGHLIICDVDYLLLAIKLLWRQYWVTFLLNNNIGKYYSTMNIKPFLFAGYFLVIRRIVKFKKFAVIVQFGWHLTKAYGCSSLARLIWA